MTTANEFYTKRRERFLNEAPYTTFVKGEHLDIAEDEHLLGNNLTSADDDAYRRWNWGIATARLHLLIGHYSAGDPIEAVKDAFPPVLTAMEASSLPNPHHRTEAFHLAETDAYAYAMWLLSLCTLLGHHNLLPRVVALFDVAYEDNRDKDALFEALVKKLGLQAMDAKGTLKNLKAHPLLLQAIQAEPKKRPLFVAEFLKKWYPSMKGCYWYGVHEKAPTEFFGYWAFEAGLVTYLWQIDDSGYRDLPFYPKDLVDYAREHGISPPARRECRAQQPCPKTGYWSSPDAPDSRQYFKEGAIMPGFPSAPTETTWYWDDDQESVR